MHTDFKFAAITNLGSVSTSRSLLVLSLPLFLTPLLRSVVDDLTYKSANLSDLARRGRGYWRPQSCSIASLFLLFCYFDGWISTNITPILSDLSIARRMHKDFYVATIANLGSDSTTTTWIVRSSR